MVGWIIFQCAIALQQWSVVGGEQCVHMCGNGSAHSETIICVLSALSSVIRFYECPGMFAISSQLFLTAFSHVIRSELNSCTMESIMASPSLE